MDKWDRKDIQTPRGTFEVFMKGKGEPLCVTHLYSEFNETGDYFAESFVKTHKVLLVNLREAGNSAKADNPNELSMIDSILDLEAIRHALGFEKWGFAGHSTGGMLGVVYGIYFSNSLTFNVVVGAAAREYMTFSPDCIYHKEHPKYRYMQDLMETLKRADLSTDMRKELTKERTKLSLFKPELHDEFFSLKIQKKISAVRLNYFSREVLIFDVTKKLKLISTPTLIVCGKYDVQCPVTYSIEMNELIPDSKLVIFDRSNHYPFLEESAEFEKEMKTFMISHT
ncbi:alpha/beta hydrolase [Mesobacillus maritimus]|uniref:alpha/beta fold hydrolase n=1 Tax=Mesobacillus maritimus TaxID=1643336 RepID=UPI00203DFC60|nr:alpha/beta hydrolase [Mesobacillus maritimus]MCM3585766.1 alpha/beta hydrolase [Mesobacillus maritimus]